MTMLTFGRVKNPCPDCLDGYCSMNCSGRVLVDEPTTSAVKRVQAWLADEREAGRCVLTLPDEWIARLLKAAQ